MKKKKNQWNKVGPIYIVGGIWLFWSWIFPLYKPWHFILLIILSMTAFSISKATVGREDADGEKAGEEDKKEAEKDKAAEKKEAEPEIKKRPRTGDAAIDKMLDDEEKAIAEMHRLDDAIPDEKISAQIVHLEEVTTKIVNCVVEQPKKKTQVRRFFNYYLPTTIKLLNAYDRMDETGISGINIDGTKGKVETMLDTALAAFDKQLDALYSDEALDISTDISVMESLLAQEGLVEDEMQNKSL